MNSEIMQFRKIERAKPKMTRQARTFIGKGTRAWQIVQALSQVDPSIVNESRDRYKGNLVGDAILSKSALKLLTQPELNSNWCIVTLDKLMEGAWTKGYKSFSELKKDFEILPLGGSECTVEIACDPSRLDIEFAFLRGGRAGLVRYAQQKNIRIATDTPGIAEYFFGLELLYVLGGSLEALPKEFAPIIIGVVETGSSLDKENWLRLARINKQAVLLRSQQMLVVKKKEIYR